MPALLFTFRSLFLFLCQNLFKTAISVTFVLLSSLWWTSVRLIWDSKDLLCHFGVFFDRVRFQCKENETNIMFSVALLWGQLQAFSKFPRGKLTTSPQTNFSSNLCLSHWHCRVNPRVPGVYINTRNRRHFPLSVIRASRELVLSPGRLLFGSHNNELIADIPPPLTSSMLKVKGDPRLCTGPPVQRWSTF